MNTEQYATVLKFMLGKYTKMPLFVYGHSGIGKTTIPEDMAKENNLPYVHLDATGMEPQDLLGLPFREEQYTRFLPPYLFNQFKQHDKGILVIDEVTRLDLSVRNVIMQLLDRRELGEIKVPQGWLILLLANPPETGYQVSELDVALLRRCMVLKLNYSLDSWRTWAAEKLQGRIVAVAGRLSAGINKEGKNDFKQIVTPFGLHIASELLSAGVDESEGGLDIATQGEIFAGVVGGEAAQAIINFLTDEKIKAMLGLAMQGKEVTGKSPEMTELVYLFLEQAKKKVPNKAKRGDLTYNLYNCIPSDVKAVLVRHVMNELLSPEEGGSFFKMAADWAVYCAQMRKNK